MNIKLNDSRAQSLTPQGLIRLRRLVTDLAPYVQAVGESWGVSGAGEAAVAMERFIAAAELILRK